MEVALHKTNYLDFCGSALKCLFFSFFFHTYIQPVFVKAVGR